MIQIIDHAQQRYDTVGDWFFEKDILHIRVSELPNDPNSSMALAIAFHEFCEVILCNEKGISQKDVDKFDMDWTGLEDFSEPGDDPDAPYHLEHSFATSCERMLIAALGIPWANYERMYKFSREV